MKNTIFAIIEIGSNNTKTHVYDKDKVIYENTTTIEFKKNYQINNKIVDEDLESLFTIILNVLNYTKDIHIYGCSIFRSLRSNELKAINTQLRNKFSLEIEVVSQEKEALYTALGCYNDIDYQKTICIFIGGGGSIELLFVQNKKVLAKKMFPFGVVDITKKFPSLKSDIPTCTFDEVYNYVDSLIGDLENKADILILAGGDHLYWYNNASYTLRENKLYKSEKQKYLLDILMSDKYDNDAFATSLDKIRNNSDNPLWFDGARAMKVITNLISHKILAKYLIPTKINMEDGIKEELKTN